MHEHVSHQVCHNVATGNAQQVNAQARDVIRNQLNLNFGPSASKPGRDIKQDCITAMRLTGAIRGTHVPTIRGTYTPGTCRWIKTTQEYKCWCGGANRNLWITGKPGRGKTFLSMYLVDELAAENETSSATMILKYFCDNQDSQLNTAHAVLTGFLYQLLDCDKELAVVNEILAEFKRRDKDLFTLHYRKDLCDTFNKAVSKFSGHLYLVLDGLDECDKDSIDFLVKDLGPMFWRSSSIKNLRCRMIIVSRQLQDVTISDALAVRIDKYTKEAEHDISLHIRNYAVQKLGFEDKTAPERLSDLNRKGQLDPLDQLCTILLQRANGTFLWVALAMEMLNEDVVEKILNDDAAADQLLPRGLDLMVNRMLLAALEVEDYGSSGATAKDVAMVVHWVSLAFRPLTVNELCTFTGASRMTIRSCQHFLSLSDARIEGNTELQLIHQSLKTYLLKPHLIISPPIGQILRPYLLRPLHSILRGSYVYFAPISLPFVLLLWIARDFLLLYRTCTITVTCICGLVIWRSSLASFIWSFLERFEQTLKLSIFSINEGEAHGNLLLKCMDLMEHGTDLEGPLKKNICDLKSWGVLTTNVPTERVTQCLQQKEYACCYWMEHLLHVQNPHLYNSHVLGFLRTHFLHWLEALSLCKSMSKGVVSMAKLEVFMQGRTDTCALNELVTDARRFTMSHKSAIENSPLQAYASALLFSPAQSLIRGLFKQEEPNWITIKPDMEDKWSPCLQTFEDHRGPVSSVAFSHDSVRVASASGDKTVKIWNISSGVCVQTLEGHLDSVSSVAFSHDSAQVASASWDKTVKIWEASSGVCIQTLKGHCDYVWSIALSHDSTRVASASWDSTVKIWNISRGVCVRTFEGHRGSVSSVAFSHDSAQVASASWDNTVKIWEASSGICIQTLKGHLRPVWSVAFSHDSARVASASHDMTVKIWNISSGACIQTFRGHRDPVRSVAFSHNSARVASASFDRTVKIWNTSGDTCVQTFEGHRDSVWSIALSHDSTRVASASWDNTVKIWEASSGVCVQTLEGHCDPVRSVAFSHDSVWIASASDDQTVKIWDISSGVCVRTLNGHRESVAFSHDSVWIALASHDMTVKIWDISSGVCVQTLEGHCDPVRSVAFSYDSVWIASASKDQTVKIWEASSGVCVQTLEGHLDSVSSVAFSHDSAQVASASGDKTVKIWNISSGACLQTLRIGKTLGHISFDITGSYLHTDIGTVNIRASSGSVPLPTNSGPCSPQYQGLALSVDGVWITHDLKNLVWLPSEYRPLCSAVSSNTIGIGVGTGRVWICKAKPNMLT